MASLINVHPPLNVHARPMGVVATTHRTKHTADAGRGQFAGGLLWPGPMGSRQCARSQRKEGTFGMQDTGTQEYREIGTWGYGDIGILWYRDIGI